MEWSGESRIAAVRPVVWAALSDLEFLGACLPGLAVSVAESTAPERLVLATEGGQGRSQAELHLDDDGAATRLRYRINAEGDAPGAADLGTALVACLETRFGDAPAVTPVVPSQEEIFAATTRAVRSGVADARALRRISPRAWLALALAIATVALLAFAL